MRSRLVRAAKAFGGQQQPGAMAQAAEQVSQMGPDHPFSPGEPVAPYDGYSRTPRQFDYQTSYNVATRPRTHERVSFDTLRGLIEAYDVAQVCVHHRIDSIRSLDWKLIADDDFNGDVGDAVAVGMAALRKPDRETSFSSWLAKYLYDVLAYDAGTLYRMRNRAGRVVGLSVPDGTTFAPLLDYWGNAPADPAEAFVQYANGVPWNWLTRGDLIYEPFRPRANSPYGHAPIESVVLNANTDLRFQKYFLDRFCYDEQTEILTRGGWKRFPDVQGDEEFATRSVAGDFEWQASKDGKLHVFDSGGTMVQFRNRDVDLLVTPNHRMLTRRKRQGEGINKTARDWEYDWHIRRADEFLGRCCVDWRLPLTASWTAPEEVPERFKLSVPTDSPVGRSATVPVDMPMWAFARFLGIFIAEGNLRHQSPRDRWNRWEIQVSQMEGGKLDEVRRILKDTGLSWHHYATERSGKFSGGNKALWLYLEQCGRGAWNKVLPDEVMDWPAELLEHLIYGLMTGDGTLNPSGTPTYITTSRRLADQVQEIWQKCGVYSSIAVRAPHPTSFSKREQYHVRARSESEFQMPKTPVAVPYDGNVYCVSVPNGIVLVRRNGKAMWCGNTDGNVPEAFASAPEGWSPDQVEQFQGWWDSFMYGDQSQKHQIKWMPGGSTIAWSNEKDFTDAFSLFLMRKTAAAFHVVPADLGFTETVNLSSSESQADVQHRVGDLPLGRHVEGIITRFLQDDLCLPLQFAFDWGEEQDDRVAQANADDVYAKLGVVGVSELREMRFGLAEPQGQQVPRFVFTTRAGPIPLSALIDVAGPVDPATGAPVPGSVMPHKEFELVEGVVPVPPPPAPALAERLYGPGAIPPALPAPPAGTLLPDGQQADAAPVAKEATTGITGGTGIVGYDGPGGGDEDDEITGLAAVTLAKAELAMFRRFEKARRKAGTWRDFTFEAVEPETARRLNEAGRSAVAKAAKPNPKAPAQGPAQTWPGWKLDAATAAYWAALIAAAVAGSLTAAVLAEIAAAYLADHPDQQGTAPGKQNRNDAAAAWLLAWLAAHSISFSLTAIAAGLVTDAWLIGAASAAALLAGGKTADTGGWEPGAEDAARARLGALGMAGALDADGDIQAARAADAITGAYTGALSRVLAGADGDASAADLASQLGAVVTDPGTAEGPAGDQVTAGAGKAKLDYCGANAVEYGWWMVDPASNSCAACLDNAAAGRVPLGEPYPSGDTVEPAHFRCRCAVVPERPEWGAMP